MEFLEGELFVRAVARLVTRTKDASPLDVPGIDLGLKAAEIVQFIRGGAIADKATGLFPQYQNPNNRSQVQSGPGFCYLGLDTTP